jgi:hypothetical protein
MPDCAQRREGPDFHRVLHKALAVAGEPGLIAGNPADRVKPPRVDEVEIEILTEVQVGQMLAKFRGEPLYLLVALRSGPVCAAASLWRCPGETSTSMPTGCGSNGRWSKPARGGALNRRRPGADAGRSRCPHRSPADLRASPHRAARAPAQARRGQNHGRDAGVPGHS